MSYNFRIQLTLPKGFQITSDEPRLALASGEQSVYLTTPDDETSLSDASVLTLNGSGYLDEEAALSSGRQWVSAVQIAFAELEIGADFGDRTLSGGVSEGRKKAVLEATGVELMAEPNGLIAYESGRELMFISGSASLRIGRRAEDIGAAVAAVRSANLVLGDRQLLAYHLFSATFFEANPDSKFMILMMALETLIEQSARSEEVCEHVNSLITLTRSNTSLDPWVIESLASGLSNFKKESISQAGRRLAGRLAGKTYGDGAMPDRFFTQCYVLRNKLAHGELPRPDPVSVRRSVAQLQEFVGDLIRVSAEPDGKISRVR